MNDKEFAEAIHTMVHAVRMIPNYKASEMDKKVSKAVLEKFGETCKECGEVKERNKNLPAQKNIIETIGSMMNKNSGGI